MTTATAALKTTDRTATLTTSDIRTDGGTQSRECLNESTVLEYADAMREGAEFPPVIVFHDGSDYWLADGFHRVMASKAAGIDEVSAAVHQGTRRDAILYSVASNAAHGLPRTNADKRLAVTLLLKDEEWAAWSDREIARRCCVTHPFVGRVRESILVTDTSMKAERTFTHPKTGTASTMRTENIGRRDVVSDMRVDTASPSDVVTQFKSRGIGLGYAHQAISCLAKIPDDDGLRDEAFDEVVRWIEHNR